MRKDMDLGYSDSINTYIDSNGELLVAIKKFSSTIMKETLTDKIISGNAKDFRYWDIEDKKIGIKIEKIN